MASLTAIFHEWRCISINPSIATPSRCQASARTQPTEDTACRVVKWLSLCIVSCYHFPPPFAWTPFSLVLQIYVLSNKGPRHSKGGEQLGRQYYSPNSQRALFERWRGPRAVEQRSGSPKRRTGTAKPEPSELFFGALRVGPPFRG